MSAPAPSSDEERPLGRAFLALAALGAFFYASYGFSNWAAGQRAHVPSVAFDWERAIPFMAWTIVPYWTTNLFYGGSLLLARTRAELGMQARRLLTAQIIAVLCFIVFPLRFTWPRPVSTGAFSFFYDALGAFDLPFNQAPSLHVALTVIFIAFYQRLLPRWAFALFLGWSALVIVSTLTSWQHHFIDLPLGALLGLFCVWLWRADGSCALATWRLTREPRRKLLALRYAKAAAILALSSTLFGGAWLWLLWPAFALLATALAYLGFGPELFQKSEDGRIAWPVRIALAPYLIGAWLNSRWWTRREPTSVMIADGVSLGRFPSAVDARAFACVVDLTCEFSRPSSSGRWIAVPMLDLVSPGAERLRDAARAIEEARLAGPTLVCCALGYGRSVAAAAVWLTQTGRAADKETALRMLKEKRERMVLKEDQLLSVAEAIRADAA
ncbi:MAG: hypothetical protein BGP06_12945 [Rhizobiales bacterium 65-9]|nr:phosphatase PAP2/dual specificity phosphatase family protein [Hyphomicrobiales bacterium]OJY38930.1 MAG: hypothetical protein BGP06_12945 [Rhizobiales bacterium 65-9]